jgi:hypothetical protein
MRLRAYAVATGLVLAGALLDAQPARAVMSGPINILSCTVEGASGSTIGSNALHIVWMNTKAVPATHIRFHVTYAGVSLNIREHGTFSQGAKIDKHYNAFNGIGFTGSKPQVCAVQQVSFSDGSIVAP